MERRKFVIGAGALATGSAAAMGTGAFSAVEADRTATVNVAGDGDAYLGISGDSDYTTGGGSNDTLEVDFAGNGNGSGLNANATSEFTDLLTVSNQGTDNVLVWINLNDLNDESNIDFATAYLSMDSVGAGMDGGDGTSSGQGTSGVPGQYGVILAPGASADIALQIETGSTVPDTIDSEISVYGAAEDSELFQDLVDNYDFTSPDVTE